MPSEVVEYRDGDLVCRGFLVRPEDVGRRRPGILVAHEGPGLNDHAKMRAGMLAELGYVAFALDMYGGGRVLRGKDMSDAMGKLRADRAALRKRAQVALDVLARVPEVEPSRCGAMGYCFGGLVVLELARSGAPVKGVVSFHGLLVSDREDGRVEARVLVCTGADDPLVPPQQVLDFQREMSIRASDWQVVVYGGAKHGFTNANAAAVGHPAIAYSEAADRRSWQAMRGFWKETLGA
jgi:dienelactone hydrolase